MDHVLTLIAGTQAEPLSDSLIADLRRQLHGLGADVGQPDWLAVGRAVDIAFGHLAAEQADGAARKILAGAPVDVVAQMAEGRKKKLLVADMDATMVQGETLDELAEFAGIKDRIAAITARAMNGELGFEAALKERIGLLSELKESALEKCWAKVELMPGAQALVRTMKAGGAAAVLVSGGFTFFTSRVRELCGFDEDRANRFIFQKGKLAGVEEPILGREAKLATLLAKAGEMRIPLSATLAVGDGANDLDMIKAAGLGVAYHAKPVVAAEARVRIDHGDLTALLFAQGWRLDEFVS
ncbi:Phosphoserine phosphatase (PSP) [Magnetospirillum sp. LM-5]|uniref:phosphoserine phosphatase SerB n=1 Tax=Magnetospirillum sp. LM-5 TaxID=2681466 RepID=UPI001382C3E4|nr:phosphoserine phosphatase SerB [Magnetospirillum sp. LM-5]CAA7621479.1 Phosphoserine phosphatase (PSP) [Magnetospirillum sp. LM-5]